MHQPDAFGKVKGTSAAIAAKRLTAIAVVVVHIKIGVLIILNENQAISPDAEMTVTELAHLGLLRHPVARAVVGNNEIIACAVVLRE